MNSRPTTRVPDRSDLRFVEAVRDEFAFLVDDFGFHLVSSTRPTFVRYESSVVFVNVYHGRQSYEINVEIGLRADPVGRAYRIADVISSLGVTGDGHLNYFQASKRQSVRACIRAVAKLVVGHYGSLLTGDARLFERVAAHSAATARALTQQVVHRPARQSAEKAWRAKDLASVREHYESIGEDLSPVERNRLDYAKKYGGKVTADTKF